MNISKKYVPKVLLFAGRVVFQRTCDLTLGLSLELGDHPPDQPVITSHLPSMALAFPHSSHKSKGAALKAPL